MTTIAVKHKSVHQKLKAVSLPTINWKAVYFLGIPALFLMLIFYVYSINTLTGGSYVIKAYSKEVDKLQTENNNLEAGVATFGIMANAQTRAWQLGFEKTTKVQYIEVTKDSLVKAN